MSFMTYKLQMTYEFYLVKKITQIKSFISQGNIYTKGKRTFRRAAVCWRLKWTLARSTVGIG